MNKISIEELNRKFNELHDLICVIEDYKAKREEFSKCERIIYLDGKEAESNNNIHLYTVLFNDEDYEKYNKEIIRLTIDYLNKSIYDKSKEYVELYDEVETICNSIEGVDFSGQLNKFKI